jgi:hypothetical protein
MSDEVVKADKEPIEPVEEFPILRDNKKLGLTGKQIFEIICEGTANDIKDDEISQKTGLTREHVCRVSHTDKAEKRIEYYKRKRKNKLGIKGLTAVESVMGCDNPNAQVAAAKVALQMSGDLAETQTNIQVNISIDDFIEAEKNDKG